MGQGHRHGGGRTPDVKRIRLLALAGATTGLLLLTLPLRFAVGLPSSRAGERPIVGTAAGTAPVIVIRRVGRVGRERVT
jgi:hypothetical protein